MTNRKTFDLSVITIVLNGEKHIECAIKSLIEQKPDNVEYIVKDGTSTDGTLDLINKYRDSIDYIYSIKDSGISNAFNQAISKCNGHYLLFLNSDDWLEPDAIQIALSAIQNELNQEKQADLICFGTKFWNADTCVNKALSKPAEIINEPTIHHGSCLMKRQAFERFGLFDEAYRYAMDYELFLRFICKKASYISINKYIMNRRLGGISYKHNHAAIRETLKARKNYFKGFRLYKWYYYAILKNNIGRFLRLSGMGFIYKLYWRIRNKKWAESN